MWIHCVSVCVLSSAFFHLLSCLCLFLVFVRLVSVRCVLFCFFFSSFFVFVFLFLPPIALCNLRASSRCPSSLSFSLLRCLRLLTLRLSTSHAHTQRTLLSNTLREKAVTKHRTIARRWNQTRQEQRKGKGKEDVFVVALAQEWLLVQEDATPQELAEALVRPPHGRPALLQGATNTQQKRVTPFGGDRSA